MRNASLCLMILFLTCLLPQAGAADVQPVFEEEPLDFNKLFDKYWNMRVNRTQGLPTNAEPGCPGLIAGSWPEGRPDRLFTESWPFRRSTYEIYFPDSRSIARVIYSLALFTRDLDQSVTLERFEKGAGGFHYRVDQIVDWADAVVSGRHPFHTQEEQDFLETLVKERVIINKEGRHSPTGRVNHVLGAAPQKKRSLEKNLKHERIHVLWDEDQTFRDRYLALWRELPEPDRQAVIETLKGYDSEGELQIVEEWAVREEENNAD